MMIKATDIFIFLLIVIVGLGVWGYKNDYIGSKKESFVVLDIEAIVDAQRKQIDTQIQQSGKLPTEEEINLLVARKAALIERTIHNYAKEAEVLVIEKGVIISGNVRDITDELLKIIK